MDIENGNEIQTNFMNYFEQSNNFSDIVNGQEINRSIF